MQADLEKEYFEAYQEWMKLSRDLRFLNTRLIAELKSMAAKLSFFEKKLGKDAYAVRVAAIQNLKE